MTSSKQVTRPFTPDKLLNITMSILEDSPVRVISPGKQAIEIALIAAAKHGIRSAKIFDLLIYGTMREHGIVRIATFNEKDFRDLDGIELVSIP